VTGPAPAGPPLIPDELRATLVLVRHGQSTFVAAERFQGRLDPPLSPLGERQAAMLGSWLAQAGGPPGLDLPSLPRELVHSPLSRAARSAELIAAALESGAGREALVPVRPESALAEIGQGDWEGRTMAEVAERWPDQLDAWRRSPTTAWAPGGESFAEADLRIRAAAGVVLGRLTRLPASKGTGSVSDELEPWSLVVAHDGILRLLLLALLELPLERFWSFPFALCAATVVDLRGGRAVLRAHNLAGHLSQLAATGAGGGADPGILAGPAGEGPF
jgi:broad specificity phosphatase PhoE